MAARCTIEGKNDGTQKSLRRVVENFDTQFFESVLADVLPVFHPQTPLPVGSLCANVHNQRDCART